MSVPSRCGSYSLIKSPIAALVIALTVGQTAYAVIIPTGDVTPVYDNSDPWDLTSNILIVGGTGVGTLEINSGSSVNSLISAVGNQTTGDGVLTVTGANSTLNATSLVNIAGSGTGELNVEAGGQVNALGVAMAGGSSSISTSTVTGADSQLSATSIMVVGGAINPFTGDIGPGGDATLTVNSGGSVTVGDAATPLASGLVISADGPEPAGGALTVFGGGQIDVAGDTVIGQGFNEFGSVTLTGAGAQLTHGPTGQLVVGDIGTGTLNIEAGAMASADRVFASRLDGEGTVNITGSGSLLSASSFDIQFGSGTLNITDGGRLATGGSTLGIDSIDIDVTISGQGSEWENTGSLNMGFVSAGATITVDDGGVLKTNGATLATEDSGATVVDVSGMGSLWQENGTLRVGSAASGTINVSDEGTLTTNTRVVLGQSENGSGTINVTGSGSQWTHSGPFLFLGFERGADGFVNISQGATASITSATVGGGDSSVSTGMVTVDGGGSRLDASDFVGVGSLGDGTLQVTNGGVAVLQSVGIALFSTSDSVVTVRDASSLLRVRDDLRVGGGPFGAGGTGTLNIEAGGRVRLNDTNAESTLVGLDISGDGPMPMDGVTMTVYAGGTINNETNASIGSNAGEYGTAIVTGAGATWNNGDYLEVGLLGTGTLMIEAGGVVNSTDGLLGNFAIGTGAATVTGPGSQWNMTGNLEVGPSGSGTLTIETGGVVSVLGASTIGANGAVDLAGGRFEFGTMSPADFGEINGVTGALAGVIDAEAEFFGVNDVDELQDADFLSGFTNLAPAVDTSEVTFSSYSNSGTILGNGVSNLEITNNTNGSLVASSFDRMRFEANGINNGLYAIQVGEISFGGRVTNNASINLSNNTIETGRLIVDGDLDNESTGTIRGEGSIRVGGTFTNRGAMNLNEEGMEIRGVFVNDTGGSVLTTGGGTTTFFDSVEHNGAAIETATGSSTVFRGEYSGAGEFTGDGLVQFEGPVNLGNSTAEVAFGGDVTLTDTAVTTVEIGGPLTGEFDRFDIDGEATIDGDLLVSLINGFTPSLGDAFEILTATSVSGAFDSVTLPGAGYELVYSATAVRLVATSALSGDYNNDGVVDAADYTVWRDNEGAAEGTLLNDFEGGPIGQAQYDAWIANFGATLPSPAAAVPEPATAVLMLFAMIAGRSPRK